MYDRHDPEHGDAFLWERVLLVVVLGLALFAGCHSSAPEASGHADSAKALELSVCLECPVVIPDGRHGGVEVSLGVACPVESVSVAVSIAHPWRQDLVVQAVGDGAYSELWSNVGGRGVGGFNVVITDDAEVPFTTDVCNDGVPTCTGTYSAEGGGIEGQWGRSSVGLGPLDGSTVYGLRVIDISGGDEGVLEAVAMSYECAPWRTYLPFVTKNR